MQPGDTIQPMISIANLGTAATSGTVQVALVASTSPNFTVGSSIVALYDITSSIPSASEVPPGGTFAAFSQTVSPQVNTVTFTGPSVTLPTSPRKYYLGVVVDPYGKIQQLSTPANRWPTSRSSARRSRTCRRPGSCSTANSNPFPLPPSGVFIGINPTTTSTVRHRQPQHRWSDPRGGGCGGAWRVGMRRAAFPTLRPSPP